MTDPRPARRPLTRDLILRSALAIIDGEGLDALTMRKLGAALGVDPMAVYRHVPDKAALLDGIGEMIWLEALDFDQLSVARGGWRELLAAAMTRFREVLLRHPRAAVVVATHPLVTPRQLEAAERSLELLEAAGLPLDHDALFVVNCAALFTIGQVLAEAAEPAGGAGGEFDESLESVARLPRMGRLLAGLTDEASRSALSDLQFQRGLTALLAGW